MSQISGFFLHEENEYVISLEPSFIRLGEKEFSLDRKNFIRTEIEIYLNSKIFGSIFGLTCNFNFRELNVVLDTEVELPIIRMMMREKARKNLKQIFQTKSYDRLYGIRPSLLTPGVMDWSITSRSGQGRKPDLDYNLSVGLEIAGGGFSSDVRHNTKHNFSDRNINWGWHYVNNQNSLLRQLRIGSVTTPKTMNLPEQFHGLTFKNQCTLSRTKYSTHYIRDYTEPGWLVELYIENQLVDFVTADETGYYEFEVPIRYGSTNIKLIFYGQWGEEKMKESHIKIPHVFLPPGEMEYSLILASSQKSHYKAGFLSFKKGISNFLTSGLEIQQVYGMAPETPRNISFFSTLRLGNRMLISGEVHSMGKLFFQTDYMTESGFSGQLTFRKQGFSEIFNRDNVKKEISGSINLPHKILNLPGRTFLSVSDVLYQTNSRLKFVLNMSTTIGKLNPHIQSHWEWQGNGIFNLYTALTDLTISFKLPYYLLRLRPMLSFDHRINKICSVQLELERKVLKKGWFSFRLNKYHNRSTTAQVNFQYEFSSARLHSSIKRDKNRHEFLQTVSGSVGFIDETKSLITSKRQMTNSGGITIIPFLDLNNNGKYETNEPKVPDLAIRTSGGRVNNSTKDTVIYIYDLPAHSQQYLEFSDDNFENIAWGVKFKSIAVSVEAHKFKAVFLPIIIRGEISGRVVHIDINEEKGLPGIKIHLKKKDGSFEKTIMSTYDGYFDYLGLLPGSYVANIDAQQLKRLSINHELGSTEFEIRPLMEGDFIDDMDFILR